MNGGCDDRSEEIESDPEPEAERFQGQLKRVKNCEELLAEIQGDTFAVLHVSPDDRRCGYR